MWFIFYFMVEATNQEMLLKLTVNSGRVQKNPVLVFRCDTDMYILYVKYIYSTTGLPWTGWLVCSSSRMKLTRPPQSIE